MNVFAWSELILGGLLLYFGAEWLVRGAAGLALALRIEPLIVGLTVVAYGTSAPELVVGITAALQHRPELALGNSVGSNIANLGLILGLTGVISPPFIDRRIVRREAPFLLASALVVPLLLINGTLSRLDGAFLIACAVAYSGWMIVSTTRAPMAETEAMASDADEAGAPEAKSARMLGVIAVVGLVLLIVGGKFFVDGAVGVARAFGLSERLVGLTIVAVGTSMPELAASLVAALRGHSSIAVGNVVGSNIFNIFLILGVSSLIRPMEVSLRSVAIDLGFLIGMTAIAVIVVRTARRMKRIEGVIFLASYVVFLAAIILL